LKIHAFQKNEFKLSEKGDPKNGESTEKKSRTEGMPQAVECLLCKCKALSSNPSPTKRKKKVLS
jgi:hypothetical protein